MRILWMLYKNDDSQKRKSPFCERCSFWTIDRHIACQSFVWKWSDYTYKMVQCVKYTFNFSECELLELIASTKYSHVLRVVVMSSQYFLYWIQWACQATTRRASVRWSWKWQHRTRDTTISQNVIMQKSCSMKRRQLLALQVFHHSHHGRHCSRRRDHQNGRCSRS